jgi:Aspartyl protease
LSLRSIVPYVNNFLRVECIVDQGCQIIAMSQDICHALGLIYDTTVVLNMQSANGEVDKSLGLARNVPFQLGSATVFLQVHIIRSPAYNILLGRPFDVLTESVVRNFANKEQTITITDSNSRISATVPTFRCGSIRRVQEWPKEGSDFRDSMN